jgi:hypothetical protein
MSALLVCCAVLPLLSSCSFYNRVFHRDRAHGCGEKPFAQNTQTRPALTVPEGMSAPDTRNSIKIPVLDTPERVRTKAEPCLAQPPSFKTGKQPDSPMAIPGAPVTEMKPPPPPPSASPSSAPPAPVTAPAK